MKLKSEALYFEINPSRNKPIGYIRNSYREDGKVKHQTVSKIHGLSLVQLKNMKAAFDGEAMSLKDLNITGGREYGASAMLFELAKKIGLDRIIYSRNDPWVRDAMAMIIGRIVYQGSKLSLSNVTDISCLWEICGVSDKEIDVDKHCYDSMDELLERQGSIQKKLAAKHLAGGSVILYDITSTYFEGEHSGCEQVAYGYSRDKKRGKKQITIGLICTKEGCPVAVEVFAGNTTDCTTVQDKIKEIKETYKIADFVFVGDRGMLTQKNIDACGDIANITALTHDGIKKLCRNENVQFSLFDEDVGTEIILPEEADVRYILRKNPIRKEAEQKTRLSLIAKTEEKLTAIATPKKKADDKTLTSRAAKIFCKYKTGKYFEWCVKDGGITFSRKPNVISDEEQYDGLYVIRSNISTELMTKCEVVNAYKSLINVEQAFRNMKSVHLEMRPVFHQTADRIKAHVFICMLSYYLLWHMNTALTELYDEDRLRYTHSHVLEIMKTLQKCKLTIGDTETYTIAQPTEIQSKIHSMVLRT